MQRDLLHVLLEDVVVEDALHGRGSTARPGSVIRSVKLHLHERNFVAKTLATATAMPIALSYRASLQSIETLVHST